MADLAAQTELRTARDGRLEAVLNDGFSLLRAGNAVGAAALLEAEAARRPAPEVLTLWAQAELAAGREEKGRDALQAALAAPPAAAWARAMLARLLLTAGRPADALRASSAADATAELIAVRAEAFTQLGDPRGALEAFERLLPLIPNTAPARHNMASLLADLGDFERAEVEIRAALGGGLDAPETWVVLGRALQGLDRHVEAEHAFEAAVERRPGFVEAHRRLADLRWMRTGDAGAALCVLDADIARLPSSAALMAVKARVLEYVGEPERGYEILAESAARSGNPWLELAAAQAALAGAPERALAHAQRAVGAGARTAEALISLAEANLAVGRADVAIGCLSQVLAQDVNHQRALCLLAMAYRLGADRRYGQMVDYDRLVRAYRLETPEGWASLEEYLAALATELLDMHTLRAHPIGQSLRGGTQTQANLLSSERPATKAFFQAIDAPLRRYIAAGTLTDWGRTSDYRIAGAWSVRLTPGGRHVSHMHPEGRISSACHIVLPGAVATGRQGWLCFGQPDVPTTPALEADHFVEPKCGQLVLFPSYLSHGTVPFEGDADRLTIAFDVVPARTPSC